MMSIPQWRIHKQDKHLHRLSKAAAVITIISVGGGLGKNLWSSEIHLRHISGNIEN